MKEVYCTYCELVKPSSEFSAEKGKNKHICKMCLPSYNRDNWYKRTYGISLKDYIDIFKEQEGLCRICKEPETVIHGKSGSVQNLAVDHCHDTGMVRGLLCAGCNNGLGRFRDDPERLKEAIKYLEEGVKYARKYTNRNKPK